MDQAAFFKLIASGDGEAAKDALAEEPGLANIRNGEGTPALQWAAFHRKPEMIKILLEAHPEVDLFTACAIGQIESVQPLSAVNDLSPDGFTPLGLAAAFGHNEIVRLLIENHADVNLPSRALGKVPPLQSAVFGRNLEAVRLLLDHGADVNGSQGGDFTALMGASQNGASEIVRLLLERGANPMFANCEGKRALDFAVNDEIKTLLAPSPQG